MKTYGSRELINCLTHLKYKEEPQVGSRHLKYRAPKHTEAGFRPFIVVIQNRNTYDPNYQRDYIKKIKLHGFTDTQIMEAMWGKDKK